MKRKNLRMIIWMLLFAINLLLFLLGAHRCIVAATDKKYPTAGVTSILANYVEMVPTKELNQEKDIVRITAEVEDEETIKISEGDEAEDLSCWKLYTAPTFRKLGRVKYGAFTYTWYSQKVLPGGGLNIPGRHLEQIDGLEFVCDENGYIVVASDDYEKGVVVNTPVGRKGKIYDAGSGIGNLDLYCNF